MFSDKMKENLVVVIPAYEPTEEFIGYAARVAGFARRLVVVNDGSGRDYDGIFESLSKIENVTYLSYPENHGKGYALKYAMSYCIREFGGDDVDFIDCEKADSSNSPCDSDASFVTGEKSAESSKNTFNQSPSSDIVIVTADCDGQHKLKDILRVYRAALEHSDALVLGSRDFDSPNVPFRSKLGNQPMRFFFRVLYGQSLYDTQTGLRGFSLEVAKGLTRVRGNRFEYELGCLIYARRERIPILEVSIDTVYPDDPADHKSHFKSISDSLRVLGVLLGNLGSYIASSSISAVVDVLIFMLLTVVVFPELNALNTLIATLSARVISSLINYTLNRRYVFKGAKPGSMPRYYLLWVCQLAASYGLVTVFRLLGTDGVWLTVMKGVGDLALAFISYQIQQHWVFGRRNPRKIWGPMVSCARVFARLFSKKYRSDVIPSPEGAVYVCRHLNMHGPYTTLKWLGFDVRPMVLSVFHTEDECYKQYAEYTFTKRVGKEASRFNLGAYLASRAVPPLVRSINAIPVYRGTIDAVKTFRASLTALGEGHSIIVYPDIDYTAEGGSTDIYDGFLYLGERYRKSYGRSLRFIPLYIDDECRRIVEYPPITVDSFKEDKARAKEYLECAINGKPEASKHLPSSLEFELELEKSLV